MSDDDFPITEQDANVLAEGLMQMAEMVDDMQAAVASRRDKLIADGFSPTAAESMAETMWRALWAGGGAK